MRRPHPTSSTSTGRAAPITIPRSDPREGALAHTMGLPDLMARVLLARGLDDPTQIRRYLRPGLDGLHDPFAFTQMSRAVERVRRAIRDGEPIMVHGDYDVDGISGTVLLMKLFQLMQADAKPFIPNRQDGYSFSQASLDAVKTGGFGLCISVDNGTNACEVIDQIQAAGCDVLVTDHHGTSENVAAAHTILNPRLPDAGYPDRDLAGVGVAFCLAKAIAASFSRGRTLGAEFKSFLLDAMTYVALGTIADVAPLRGENRTLVLHGLRALAESRNPGIRALLDSAKLGERSPDAEDVAFRIAPLINAAGRMGRASDAVDLLLAPGYQEAQEAAKRLENHNDARRKIERRIFDEALEEARQLDDPILVLGRDGWHHGVLGIVASRLAETLLKPTVLLAFEPDSPRGRGSGRSGGNLHLRDALGRCSELLVSHGGHAAAVGLEIERDQLLPLRRAINERAGADVVTDTVPEIDGAADFAELDVRTLRRMDMLGPFGRGNRRPTFVTRGVALIGSPTLDARGIDLRFRVAHTGTVLPARLKHGAARFEELRAIDGPLQLVHTPRISYWAEEGPVELQVLDLRRGDSRRPERAAEQNAQS